MRIKAVLLLLTFCLHSFLAAELNLFVPGKSAPVSLVLDSTRLEVGYVTGNFIGLKQDYLDIGAFAPVAQIDDLFTFVDAKGYRFDNSKWGASAGFGFRTWSFSDNYLIGSNVYYDFLQGHWRDFNRIGFGLELLGWCWDLRLNGYVPVLDFEHHSKRRVFDDFEGDYCAFCVKREFSPRAAFDLELGIPIGCWCNFSSYFALGPYYYNWRHYSKSYWGGQARLEFYWKTFLSIQVQTSYDRVNHSQTEGKFMLFLPLDLLCFEDSHDPCVDLLYQPVQRNGIIFTRRCCDFKWNW